jgi:hypothetical protein
MSYYTTKLIVISNEFSWFSNCSFLVLDLFLCSFADGHKKSRHGHQFQMVARALYPWLKTSISVHRTSDVANLPSSLAILYFAACLDERI